VLGDCNAKLETASVLTSGAAQEHGGIKETPVSPARSEAMNLFKTVCSVCHGADGRGEGVAAESLTVKPRDWTAPQWQRRTSDQLIAKVILEGGLAVGLSGLMPPNPQLRERPEVVRELVRLVRGFSR
jgi:mono/diheme cytochrome c family protein